MKLFAIFKKDLLVFLRNRVDVAVEILMPLAFIIPVSLALGSGDGYGIARNNSMVTLPVVNYDQGPRAQMLMTGMGESLKLEYGYDAQRVRSVGLQDDGTCQQAASLAKEINATATAESKNTPAPSLAPTTTGTTLPSPTPTPATGAPGTAAPKAATAAAASSATPTPAGSATPLSKGATQVDLPAAEKAIALCDEKVARAMLQRSWRAAVLIIPENFTQDIDAGKPVQVSLLYDPGGDAIQMQQIEGVVKGATTRLSLQNQISSGMAQLNEMAVFAPESLRSSIEEQASQPDSKNTGAALSIQKVYPENYQLNKTPDTYQQTIPGYTVMFVFSITASIAYSLRQEQHDGTLRRLLSTPISRADFLGGKLLATVTVGLAQVLILFGVGALLFKLNLGSDPLAFLLLSLALVLAAASITLAAATTRLRGAALTAPLIVSALLGGCLFPLDLMPPFMRAMSLFVPHRWALTGYQNLIVRGQGLQEVLPQIAVLLLFAAVFFTIAARRFTFKSQEGA